MYFNEQAIFHNRQAMLAFVLVVASCLFGFPVLALVFQFFFCVDGIFWIGFALIGEDAIPVPEWMQVPLWRRPLFLFKRFCSYLRR